MKKFERIREEGGKLGVVDKNRRNMGTMAEGGNVTKINIGRGRGEGGRGGKRRGKAGARRQQMTPLTHYSAFPYV